MANPSSEALCAVCGREKAEPADYAVTPEQLGARCFAWAGEALRARETCYRLGYERQRAEVARLRSALESAENALWQDADSFVSANVQERRRSLSERSRRGAEAARAALAAPTVAKGDADPTCPADWPELGGPEVAKAGTLRLCLVCQRGEHEKHHNQPPEYGYCECQHPIHVPAPTAPAKAEVPAVLEWRRNAAAYLLDRADQYNTESPCWVALSNVAAAIARGEADEAAAHGEFDEEFHARVARAASPPSPPAAKGEPNGE